MKDTITSSTGHLTIPQTSTNVGAEADQVADLLGQRAGEHDGQPGDREQDGQTTVTPMRTGSFFQIGRPSGTSHTLLEASMNALI